jgi:hypothetical protein
MIKRNYLVSTLIPFLLAASLLAACAPAAAPRQEAFVGEAEGGAVMEAPVAPSFDTATDIQSQTSGTAERIVIKNARLEIVVDKPDESMDAISKLAEEMGGYVVSANLYQSFLDSGQEVPRASITIRVPAERLDEALERIEAESGRLPLNKTIDSQDVTSEYTDLQSRLRNLEAAEAQLTKIMEEAKRTEDVLNVYNQLVQVREQIEVIKGQIKYYDESAKLSAISVELIASAAEQSITIGGWEPVGVVKSAIQALIRALQVIVNIAIWLVLFGLPVLVVIVLPVYLIVRGLLRWRARRKARRATQAPSPPPSS